MENELMVVEGERGISLISLALEKQADPKIIEKLMDLQERWQAGQARKAYVEAMTAFKQEAPSVLKKNDRVDFTSAKGRTSYNYANLGSIVQEITAILGKHNLSASWGTEQKGADVTVTCHITHSGGHRESVTLTGPIDESGNKNRIQAVGSTVTYLQRYTLLSALGLATGEDDDDRGGTATAQKPPVQEPQKKATDKPPADKQLLATVLINDVQSKNGEKNGKPYTIYTIIDEDGMKYGTFSDTFADLASQAKAEGKPVEIHYTEGQYGRKIVFLAVEGE